MNRSTAINKLNDERDYFNDKLNRFIFGSMYCNTTIDYIDKVIQLITDGCYTSEEMDKIIKQEVKQLHT